MECDTLSISNYFIFCLIFMKYLNLSTCQKNEILSQNHTKKVWITETPIAFHLLLRLAYQIITKITAHTTLTPTRKLNGKTRVHTVFYLDSFSQEMPSLVLVKGQYFHSSFPFRLLIVVFLTRATCLTTRVACAEIECGWVVIISTLKY
jgi:hypothetical protein